MFKLYSKGCEYAIRALVFVDHGTAGGRFQAADVCAKAGVPESYTRKVFRAMVQAGFLDAVRGPGGGYELTRTPEEISLVEFICAVDGESTFDRCIMGLRQCTSEKPCPLHDVWAGAKRELLGQLARRSLQDVINIAAGLRDIESQAALGQEGLSGAGDGPTSSPPACLG